MDHLTEPGIKQYFQDSFQKCKEYKLNYYTTVVNIGLFIAFVLIVSVVLYMRKKEKLTPQQKRKKDEEDRLYIIQKIKSLTSR
jgi:hypothetical protein